MNGLYLIAVVVVVVALSQAQLALAYYDRVAFKKIVYNDTSNDDAIEMNAQQLLSRSGFSFEEHYAVSGDGYITQLIRVVNPLADRARLRSPPVMIYHGASIDQAAYLVSSSIQHHPEPWPRSAADGPVTSSNRSLGFMLANNGFDVWLIGQRGSNKYNQAYARDPDEARRLASQGQLELTQDYYELIKEDRKRYWSYGLDDIIKYEIRAQIDKVLEVTRAHEVSIFTFSLSTPTTMAFLAGAPEYARRVRVYVQMAPAIVADHFTTFDKVFFEKLCPIFPTRGVGFLPTYNSSPITRSVLLKLSESAKLRYSVVRKFLNTLFGPSLKYHTNLERNLIAHIWQPVSFKSIQQYCKQSVSARPEMFDYGPQGNAKRYDGSLEPPVYDLSRLEVQNWLVVSGTYDALADATTVQRLIERTTTLRPVSHIIAPGFNHADFLGAVENDKYVNFPVMEKLAEHSDVVESAEQVD